LFVLHFIFSSVFHFTSTAVICVKADDLKREERKLRKRLKQVGDLLLGFRSPNVVSTRGSEISAWKVCGHDVPLLAVIRPTSADS